MNVVPEISEHFYDYPFVGTMTDSVYVKIYSFFTTLYDFINQLKYVKFQEGHPHFTNLFCS